MKLPTTKLTLNELSEWLTFSAVFYYVGGTDYVERIRRKVAAGKEELPDSMLPGRMIMRLPTEMREQIKQLKSKHFNHRLKFW